MQKLAKAGIVQELPGRKYGRIFVAGEIVRILDNPHILVTDEPASSTLENASH